MADLKMTVDCSEIMSAVNEIKEAVSKIEQSVEQLRQNGIALNGTVTIDSSSFTERMKLTKK